jgi:myo-inositol catabolism protein IolC
MTDIGFDRPLYILPFDHRGSFQSGLFGWKGALTAEETARIAASKAIIYDGLLAAVAGGVPKERTGILVDEGFGAAILRDAVARGFVTAAPAEKSGQKEFERTTFWDALVGWRDGRMDREAAVADITRRYTRWCELFRRGPTTR